MKKSGLFLLCSAAMALAALAPASASAEDGVMTPAFVVVFDMAAPTALPDLDAAIINLGYDSASSVQSPSQITPPSAMAGVVHDIDDCARSPLPEQPDGASYHGNEVPTAEGVPKPT